MISAGTLPCAASATSGNGQVKLSLSYASKERKLSVIVHACRSAGTKCLIFICHIHLKHFYLKCIFSFSVHRGLLPQSKDGVDSYVSLILLPDKSKATKKKTAVKKKDHNPEFNEK